MKYYRMIQDLNALQVFIKRQSHYDGDESLKRGSPMKKNLMLPFLFNMDVDEDEDEVYLPSYDTSGPIFEKRLVDHLLELGVDNLEVFPAIITNKNRGQFLDNYFAVNIVGLVSCANMSESKSVPIADVSYFFELKVKESMIHHLMIFRLAEQPSDVVVSKTIVDAIQGGGYIGILFEEVS